MNKLFLVIGLVIFVNTSAQVPSWDWATNYHAANGSIQDIAVDAEGNTYMASNFDAPSMTIGSETIYNQSENYQDIYIIKKNSAGQVQWVRTIGGQRHDFVVSVTLSGNILYVAGRFGGELTLGGTTLNAVNPFANREFVAKYDTDGNILWVKAPGDFESRYTIEKIKSDPTGNIYMAGYFHETALNFDTVTLTNDVFDPLLNNAVSFVAKFDPEGTILWAKSSVTPPDSPFPVVPFDIAVDSDGNVFSGGGFANAWIQFDDTVLPKTGANHNTFMVKYDVNGNFQWARTGTSSSVNSNNRVRTISVDDEGNSFFSGSFRDTLTFGEHVVSSITGAMMFIVKYNSDGDALWARSAFGSYSNVTSSEVDSEGNLYVTGVFSGNNVAFGNVTLQSASPNGTLFVTKYSAGGNALWARGASVVEINCLPSIALLSPNEIYIAGSFRDPQVIFGSHVLQLTSLMNSFVARLFYTPLSTQNFSKLDYVVYPNPTDGEVNISWDQPVAGELHVEIFDALGRQIQSAWHRGTERLVTVDLRQLPSGIYTVKLSAGVNSTVRKIIRK